MDEIRGVARDDLDYVAEEIALREDDADDTYYHAVALHQDASERLVSAQSLDDLRAVARLAGRARRLIRREPVDAEPCFFDPRHGPSVRETLFAPEGGNLRPVAGCEACAEAFDAGRLPAYRQVLVGGRPQPYWRSSAHVGYTGRAATTLDDLVEAWVLGSAGSQVAGAAGIGLLEILLDSSWSG